MNLTVNNPQSSYGHINNSNFPHQNRLVFDTADKDNITRHSNGIYSLNFVGEIPCKRIVINSVIIPFSFYQCNNTNNSFSVEFENDDENEYQGFIPVGNYSFNDLLEEFKNQLYLIYCQQNQALEIVNKITVFSCFKFSYSNIKQKFTFRFDPSTLAITNPTIVLPNCTVTFITSYKLFGFNQTDKINLTPSSLYQSRNCCDLIAINSIYIRGNLQTGFLYNNRRSDIIMRIPIHNEKPGMNIVYDNPTTDKYIIKENLHYIEFYLTDNFHNFIDLNGLEFKIEMILIN